LLAQGQAFPLFSRAAFSRWNKKRRLVPLLDGLQLRAALDKLERLINLQRLQRRRRRHRFFHHVTVNRHGGQIGQVAIAARVTGARKNVRHNGVQRTARVAAANDRQLRKLVLKTVNPHQQQARAVDGLRAKIAVRIGKTANDDPVGLKRKRPAVKRDFRQSVIIVRAAPLDNGNAVSVNDRMAGNALSERAVAQPLPGPRNRGRRQPRLERHQLHVENGGEIQRPLVLARFQQTGLCAASGTGIITARQRVFIANDKRVVLPNDGSHVNRRKIRLNVGHIMQQAIRQRRELRIVKRRAQGSRSRAPHVVKAKIGYIHSRARKNA